MPDEGIPEWARRMEEELSRAGIGNAGAVTKAMAMGVRGMIKELLDEVAKKTIIRMDRMIDESCGGTPDWEMDDAMRTEIGDMIREAVDSAVGELRGEMEGAGERIKDDISAEAEAIRGEISDHMDEIRGEIEDG